MTAEEKLKNLVLAPYIIKATALIGKREVSGGTSSGMQWQQWQYFSITSFSMIMYF